MKDVLKNSLIELLALKKDNLIIEHERNIALSILEEEINDIQYLLDNNLSDININEIITCTTSNRLYNLLNNYQKQMRV